MPKKTKTTKSPARTHKAKSDDFFFLVVISVFAALTIFAASYVNTVRRQAIQASQKPATLEVVPLDLTPANPPAYHNPTPKPAKK